MRLFFIIEKTCFGRSWQIDYPALKFPGPQVSLVWCFFAWCRFVCCARTWYLGIIFANRLGYGLFSSLVGLAHCVVPSTCPPTVPSSDALPPSFSHSSGVLHLAVQACMEAISSLSAALTRRCLLRELSPWNWGETMRVVNAWPQPPVECQLKGQIPVVLLCCARARGVGNFWRGNGLWRGGRRGRVGNVPDMSVTSTCTALSRPVMVSRRLASVICAIFFSLLISLSAFGVFWIEKVG